MCVVCAQEARSVRCLACRTDLVVLLPEDVDLLFVTVVGCGRCLYKAYVLRVRMFILTCVSSFVSEFCALSILMIIAFSAMPMGSQ